MVIFRLGKMIGAHGPGKVVTFPWMDQCKRVDIRGSGFSVPPQQFITQVTNPSVTFPPGIFLFG